MKKVIAFAGFMVALGLGFSLPANAQGICDIASADSAADFDQDGFTDFQECTGITTIGGTAFPPCGVPINNVLPTRDRCMDARTKDLFVIIAPASNSLLPPTQSPQSQAPYNPFQPFNAYGINFDGLNALGLAVHKLSPAEAGLDRTVTLPVLELPAPRAIRVTESTDVNGTILGNCQWGLPSGLDGCLVFTQRTLNFINSTCGTASIQTPAGATGFTARDVAWAYITYLILHESGHSLGGLTGEFNSRFGGYHYKPGAGLVMEQAVTYSVKGGRCTFYISPNWNTALDPQAVRLK